MIWMQLLQLLFLRQKKNCNNIEKSTPETVCFFIVLRTPLAMLGSKELANMYIKIKKL